MQVEQSEAVDPDVIRAVFHKQLNSRLVIQDHLRFFRILAFGFLAKLNEALGIKPAVGIAFEAT
jgi:hypothetical protein